MVSDARALALDTSVDMQRKIQLGAGFATMGYTTGFGAAYLLHDLPKSLWLGYATLLVVTQLVSFLAGILFERERRKR